MVEFNYRDIYKINGDNNKYHLVTDKFVSLEQFDGKQILVIDPAGLTLLAQKAFRDLGHLMKPCNLKLLVKIIDDPESSDNDRYVAYEMLRNAVIAAEGEFPLSQDTGTATIIGKKGQRVWTGSSDEEALEQGVYNAYTKYNFRYSQYAPVSFFLEKKTKGNIPAQIELKTDLGDEYNFIFIAKSSATANKTFLYQETKAILNPEKMFDFMASKIRTLGTAGCPPYHIAFVVGGTSVEANLSTVKMAVSGYLDDLPAKPDGKVYAIRCRDIEKQLLKFSNGLGIGAQFGGKYFCHDCRVIRLPRHGGSCPIGLGISSCLDRDIKGKITKKGIYLEDLEQEPEKYLPRLPIKYDNFVRVDLSKPMDEIRKFLSQIPVATRLLLTGKIVVARDVAHYRIRERVFNGEELPWYLREHVLYYAGPSKTPKGYAAGSFGPTAGGRMDPYVPVFQQHGGSLITIAKGNRSKGFAESCKKYKGFYLCCLGGMAATLGRECFKDLKILEYPELRMAAVFMATVKDFPTFLAVDDKGNDFFEQSLKLPYAFSVKPHVQAS